MQKQAPRIFDTELEAGTFMNTLSLTMSMEKIVIYQKHSLVLHDRFTIKRLLPQVR